MLMLTLKVELSNYDILLNLDFHPYNGYYDHHLGFRCVFKGKVHNYQKQADFDNLYFEVEKQEANA